MIALLLLGLVAAAAGEGYSPTYEEVKALFDSLESGKNDLLAQLSAVNTDCSTNDDKLSWLKHRILPFVDERNRNHGMLIEEYGLQLKGIRHSVKKASVEIVKAQTIAEETAAKVSDQLNVYLNGTKIKGKNMQQNVEIGSLLAKIASDKAEVFTAQEEQIELIRVRVNKTLEYVKDTRSHVYSRKCESGTGSFGPGLHDVIFQTNFTETPTVSILLTGISAHLDEEKPYDHGEKKDILGLDKYIDYVDTTGFGMDMFDQTEGSVGLKAVTCSWMACQNLENTFSPTA